MHILIALISAIAGLLWALHSLQKSGVNLTGLNPFYWMRRRKWEQQYAAKPLHRLDNPMDAAAVLVVGVVKLEGDISREQKRELISLLENEFKISSDQATEMFGSCVYLLKDCLDLSAEVKNILAPAMSRFDAEKSESLLDMLRRAAALEGNTTEAQAELIEAVDAHLSSSDSAAGTGKWK